MSQNVAQPALRRPPAALSVRSAPPLGAATVGGAIVALYLALALAAPWIAPYDPAAYVGRPLELPSARHPLGTNDVGQDLLSELLHGARSSLLVGAVAATGSLVLATLGGVGAGYLGGWVETGTLRLIDLLLAIPQLPVMLLLAAYLGPGVWTTTLVITLLAWPIPARVARAQTLSLRTRGFVAAARLFGGGAGYLLRRHLVPALAPILAATFVGLAGRAIMLEAGLAFLGLGDPTVKSWGAMMRAALSYSGIFFTPHWVWWLLPPGANISLLLLGLTLIGAGLEERLDPRLQRHG